MAAKKKTGSAEPKKTRTRTKKEKKNTYVALVVDRSGSMSSVEEAALSGINEQIKTLKETGSKGGNTFVTYIQFDTVIDLVFDKKPSKDLVAITKEQYQPRGATAMYDAVWTAIKRLQDGIKETKDTAYLVVVISDGHENSSREITGQTLSQEITKLQATGKWSFAYMLSNQDLSKVQKSLGLKMGNMAAYQDTDIGTKTAFSEMAASTANYMNLRSTGTLAVEDFYTKVQKPEETK